MAPSPWTSHRSRRSTRGALALAAPVPHQPEFLVDDYTAGTQDRPHVALHSSGRLVVVWSSYTQGDPSGGYQVFGRLFDPLGAPLGDNFEIG